VDIITQLHCASNSYRDRSQSSQTVGESAGAPALSLHHCQHGETFQGSSLPVFVSLALKCSRSCLQRS